MKFILALLITSLASIVLAEEQQSPFWLAKLKVKCGDTQYYCLGSIIEDNSIITTASCITKCGDSAKITISVSRYSTVKSSDFGRKVIVNELIIHPQYNMTESFKKNDVALIKFERPNFRLAKVSLNDNCLTNGGLSVLCVNKTAEVSSAWNATIMNRKRKCNQAYKSWDDSQHICMTASTCSNKSDCLITDDQHSVLYGLPSYASECDDKNNTIIAALELCKYYQWIKNMTATGCSDPPLRNAQNMIVDVPDKFTEGAKVNYTCISRFELVGDNVLTCKSGKWVGEIPYCKDCPVFNVSNGKVIVGLNITNYLIVEIKCNTGYNIEGNQLNRCINGRWESPNVTCKAISCPVPKDIPNGSVTTTGLTYGHFAEYKCKDGYLIDGYQKRRCEADGNWAGIPPQCREVKDLFCEQYDRITCGSTANSGGLRIGAIVIYAPDPNAQLLGASRIECMPNGKWSAPAPLCRRMCTMPPPLENGVQDLIINSDTPAYEMKMSCDKGFDMIGVETVVCNDGLWNVLPSNTKCTKPCSCPEKIKNGKAHCFNVFDFLLISVTCNNGFKLQGNSIQGICQNGIYQAEIPTCEK